jgi:cell wall assembly regulator SMI1
MQKFTRSLTREIEIGGERVAVTLDEGGVTMRPVGARRPPHTITWPRILCLATGTPPDQLAAAIEALKRGAEKPAAAPEPAAAPPPAHVAEPPASPDHVTAPPVPSAELRTPAPAGTMAQLHRLDAAWEKNRAGFHQGLRPGATDSQCDSAAAALGASLPADLRALLTWHNGQNPEVFAAFFQSFHLLSADEIVEAAKDLQAQPRNGWKTELVPFLSDDQDNFVCVDTSRPGAPLVECWRGRDSAIEIASSLGAWLEGFVTAVERGDYHEDEERGTYCKKS